MIEYLVSKRVKMARNGSNCADIDSKLCILLAIQPVAVKTTASTKMVWEG